MAKRFIDTGLFDDEWYATLSINAKLFWVYYLTKCDHAGLLKYNKKLMEFQTGLKNIDPILTEVGDRIIRVNEALLFCPKFIEFQYPGFPNSNVQQQKGALALLVKNNLFDSLSNKIKDLIKSSGRVAKELPNSYVYDNGNDNVNDNVNTSAKNKKFIPPQESEVVEYFKENGYSEESARKAFRYYETNDWKDSKDNKVKNWKQKMQSVWFKDENKAKQSKVISLEELNQQTDEIIKRKPTAGI